MFLCFVRLRKNFRNPGFGKVVRPFSIHFEAIKKCSCWTYVFRIRGPAQGVRTLGPQNSRILRTRTIGPENSKIPWNIFPAELQWSRKNGKKKNENRKMKTPVYDGEKGKISPSCPIWEPTLESAIRKSCFETPHTASCVTRTALDRLGSDAGRFWHTAKKNAAVCGHTILLLLRSTRFSFLRTAPDPKISATTC